MKHTLLAGLCGLLLFAAQSIQAQNSYVLPLKSHESVMFGKDIEIYNLSYLNQQNLTICSAPNGWLYASFSFDSINHNWLSILRSEDNGSTWQRKANLMGNYTNFKFEKLVILAYGENDFDQTVLLGVIANNQVDFGSELYVLKFSGNPLFSYDVVIGIPFLTNADISLDYDERYTPPNSYPRSIGVLYSQSTTNGSIIFTSSTDGGYTFGNNKVVAQTSNRFHKVSLSFGRSASQSTGQYFAAWEEQDDTTSNLGRIYTSHSGINLTSAFTTPVQLDAIDPSLTNLCRNPVISCHVNNTDNDSANISEVVLFEKFNAGTGDYDITGFYNKKAATGATFTRLDIAATSHNELQPDITFNEFDSSFAVTCYDSTTQKLPLLKKNLNLPSPNSWEVITPGYNETYELTAPNPKVRVNMTEKKVMNGWVGKRSNGNSVALFDAPYFPPTGISEENQARLMGVYPNPCTTSLTVSFMIKKPAQVVITLFNTVGQPVGTITSQNYGEGAHNVKYDLSGLPGGIYYYTMTTGSFSGSGKICVVR